MDFFSAYIDPRKNTDPDSERGSLYLKGIGRRAKLFVGKALAEAFGIGGHKRVRQAMDRLENNIEAGDDVVDVMGFSRGAAIPDGPRLASGSTGHQLPHGHRVAAVPILGGLRHEYRLESDAA